MVTNNKPVFPLIGNVYRGDFGITPVGELCAEYTCSPDNKMTVAITKGKMKGQVHTVDATVTQLTPDIFLVTFKEESGNSVVDIQDFENGIIYINAVFPNGTFIEQLKGTLKKINPSEAEYINI